MRGKKKQKEPVGMNPSEIFAALALLEKEQHHKYITLRLIPCQNKADLSQSQTLQRLSAVKES